MDAGTLTNLQAQINNIEVCADLQSYKNQVLAMMNAEKTIIEAKITDLTTLTNPATFIANFIIITTRELASVTTLAANLTTDIATVTTLLAAQSAKIPNCTLT